MATSTTHPIIGVHRLAGRSTAINRVRSLIQQFASANVPVIVSGETGVGKEVVARALHEEGIRARAPFEVHNCSALRGELLNSALFGHEKGAFTGATSTMKGVFERAGTGTLFLDEIAEMPNDTQAILLRAIEGHPYLPVGFQRKLVFRGRLVVATHASLAERVTLGEFRGDLYFRLRGTTIDIPPLREKNRRYRAADRGIAERHGTAPLVLGRCICLGCTATMVDP